MSALVCIAEKKRNRDNTPAMGLGRVGSCFFLVWRQKYERIKVFKYESTKVFKNSSIKYYELN